MLTILPADVNDAVIIATLGARTFREAFASQMTAENVDLYIRESFNTEQIASELNDNNSRFFIAYAEDQPVGYAKLKTRKIPEQIKDRKPVELERLYVLQDHQQKKVGASLLKHCLDQATESSFDVIWLAVWSENPKAIRFYERWGFSVFDSQLFMRGNDAQTGLLMKKDLD